MIEGTVLSGRNPRIAVKGEKHRRRTILEAKKTRRERRQIRYFRWFNILLKLTFFGLYLKRAFNIRAENRAIFKKIKPPYLILPNHSSLFDPFVLSGFVPEPVYFVTADGNLRSRFMKFVLSLVGAIPKTKVIPDIETVKDIMHIKNKGGVIGIFPEGQATWDGHTLPLFYSTAKLVRLLKVPVITAIIKGAYLSLPRWAWNRRRGELVISFKLGMTPEEIKGLSVDQIHERLNKLLEYDEFEYQKDRMIEYKSNRRAEHLELALFMCPSCGKIGTMKSRRNRFSCINCGYRVRVNPFGFFEPRGEDTKLIFKTIREWSLWQEEAMEKFISERKKEQSAAPLFEDNLVAMLKGYRARPLKDFHTGRLSLYLDRIELVTLRNEKIVFPMSEIEGISVLKHHRLEFYNKNVLYRANFPVKKISGLKWYSAVRAIKGDKQKDRAETA
jgi:1-acyl-sn-glycerol-3-phosphate acyltransferase